MAQLFVRSPGKAVLADVGAPPAPKPPVVIRSAADVSDIVDAGIDHSDPVAQRRARRKTLLVMTIALGGVFVDAYDFTSLGIGTIQLRHEFHLSAAAVGLLSASMAFSAMFGALFGGYQMSRFFHFWLTVGYVLFFLVHVEQVILAGWNNFRSMVIGVEVAND